MTRARLVLVFGAACLLGCATARYIEKDANEGVVAIPSNAGWPNHREKAEALMAQHFPGGYEIVGEEEEKVGEITNFHNHNQTQTLTNGKNKFGLQLGDSHGTSTTTAQTEWRIHYRRKGTTSTPLPGEEPQPSDLQLSGGEVPARTKL